jgi:MFS transporter, SHS family, sialic acid transporter
MALTAALLGWMFDGAEMGLFSLVGRPAIQDLLGPQREAEVAKWLGVITALFLVGAATGGVLFGWLGDRVGRVRAMSISIVTYALFTSLCGLSNTPWELGIYRFIASLGMGGEWSLGVALVMETFPSKSRATMAGWIGAAANVGYLVVGFIGLGLAQVLGSIESMLHGLGLSDAWVSHLTANQGWRIMMLLGIVPAILTFFIRMMVPESEKWKETKLAGQTSHWSSVDLLGVLVGMLGPALMVYLYAFDSTLGFQHSLSIRFIATVIGLLLALGGYLYPVYQYQKRASRAQGSDTETVTREAASNSKMIVRMMLGAGLSGVALLGTWGATQQAPAWADKLTETKYNEEKAQLIAEGKPELAAQLVRPRAKEILLICLSAGATLGAILAAWLGDLLGRRKTYFALCIVSWFSAILLFQGTSGTYGVPLLIFAFIAGVCTASFYGWLPLYLPELFPTRIRATGQGFGFNFGRILAAIGSFQLGTLVLYFEDGIDLGFVQLSGGYASACLVLSCVYFIGMVLIWFAPETKGQPLPE